MGKVRMISLDTSSTDSGYAYWENGVLTEYGSINLKKEKDSLIRQEDMIIGLYNLVEKYDPEICIIEAPPLINSPGTLIMLTEIVGTVRGMVVTRSEYVEYSPHVWRKLVAKEGEKIPIKRVDCKIWDIKKVAEMYGVQTDNDDIADAILIGGARIKEIQAIKNLQSTSR